MTVSPKLPIIRAHADQAPQPGRSGHSRHHARPSEFRFRSCGLGLRR